MNDDKRLCYCQTIKQARAIVRRLIDAGYQARTDRTGYVYVCTIDTTTQTIAGVA